MSYRIEHSLVDGIERVAYLPEQPRSAPPLLFQHGMWHAAWCWADWQAALAEHGWTSYAISLPGHGQSPVQRPLRWCTLSYYLRFLTTAIQSLPQRPVLIGHSMGGALTQWYLKRHDDLPAAVLVAPWLHNHMLMPQLRVMRTDPWGSLLSLLTLNPTVTLRTAERAAHWLLSPQATWSGAELKARLGSESGLILFQHNPPLWRPAKKLRTPLLWLAGEADTLLSVAEERRSAAHYDARFHAVPGAGHNLMMDANSQELVALIHEWLLETVAEPQAAAG